MMKNSHTHVHTHIYSTTLRLEKGFNADAERRIVVENSGNDH